MIMEVERVGVVESGWVWLRAIPVNAGAAMVGFAEQARKIAADDPRKLIHSFKVGLALTLVSLFYYFQPLYTSFGVSAMWAVMTVVVVFEFSVGATLGKGVNRGLATLAAGALGLGAHHLATVTGKTCEPILIGLFVFLQAVAATFIRFFPRVKARYDYGVLIFILTFCLVSISGLRSDEIVGFAQKRFSTIVIGAAACVVVSIFVYPVWAGQDLHNLVAKNIDKLGTFLQAFGDECFTRPEAPETLVGLHAILDSKSSLETLANFARWEPGHGAFMYRHPWKQYLKIASLTRQCAYRVEPLNAYLNSQTQAPQDIQEIISRMSSESGKALKELAWTVETMTRPDSHESNLRIASKNLHSLIKSDFWEDQKDISVVIPVAAVASLLNDIVSCVEAIAAAIDELSSLANFKQPDKPPPLVSVVVDDGLKQESMSSSS
ncbi:aluminum-activated malate transporter 2-like [Salvia miltiorrhiza]|uniref:aluminum-activated malate transporter 2-like n=1 Tax=Salvia miltiorrhiza TaxID=226208 RepID=UPI0025AD7C82|nr:aluminum-activated malate transporter 2-like [Salvia miltiorrhiza]